MSATSSDDSDRNSLWLVAHERDDPMVLSQTEYAREEAAAALKQVIERRLADGVHVDPPVDKCELGHRYDVHDANGWLATYWLSAEQLPGDEGMLTAIVSPGAKQRGHHTHYRER